MFNALFMNSVAVNAILFCISSNMLLFDFSLVFNKYFPFGNYYLCVKVIFKMNNICRFNA